MGREKGGEARGFLKANYVLVDHEAGAAKGWTLYKIENQSSIRAIFTHEPIKSFTFWSYNDCGRAT